MLIKASVVNSEFAPVTRQDRHRHDFMLKAKSYIISAQEAQDLIINVLLEKTKKTQPNILQKKMRYLGKRRCKKKR